MILEALLDSSNRDMDRKKKEERRYIIPVFIQIEFSNSDDDDEVLQNFLY